MAKIVAMTATHASLKRKALLAENFSYHTLVSEESG
jgi:hypothetical protein